ncbi:hypothetical protein D9758_002320 [Tetrapyrgos nigripes]|uniref:C2H2-type domain-containing protein n=1 Tax=Tetrapyrgos nigripes TaxID=182062 RepID=A0A8H5GP42_9AGAR|nr:hypothetical protein D9758_002320 [Tetrapyrgos nigripes]
MPFICKKTFKRPQDLKKHEKIHTEEHHAQHKHSKAITVADPAYSTRVRGEPTKGDAARSKTSPSASNLRVPVPRSQSHSSSSSDGSHFGLLPTPSPELVPAPPHHHHPHSRSHHRSDDLYMQNVPAWEVLHSEPVSAGSKRSHDDYSVDDFFTDMKKRRVNPAYDSRMAERLNYLYSNSVPAGGQTQFNPRSVSLDIRTPEELAAVNEFLLTLGRDVSSTMRPPSHSHSHGHSQSMSSFSPDAYFDAATLTQMGLGGMPGMPSADHFAAYGGPSPGSYTSPPSGGNYSRHSHSGYSSSMYPSVSDHSPMSHHPDIYAYQLDSASYSYDYADEHEPGDTAAAFDYLRAPRGPGPVVGLMPQDYMGKDMRPIVPLKSIPIESSERGTPAKLSASSETPKKSLSPLPSILESTSASSSLYPLLTSGDAQYKLPPLSAMYRSSSAQPESPPSRESSATPASSATVSPDHSLTSSPSVQPTTLPSLRSIASISSISSSTRTGESDELANEVEKVELASSPVPSPLPAPRKFFDVVEKRNIPLEERTKHAELIKDLLLAINEDFRKKFKYEPSAGIKNLKVDGPSAMDVDEKPYPSLYLLMFILSNELRPGPGFDLRLWSSLTEGPPKIGNECLSMIYSFPAKAYCDSSCHDHASVHGSSMAPIEQDTAFNVLLTGFEGTPEEEHPSWLAVAPLHNVVATLDPEPVLPDAQATAPNGQNQGSGPTQERLIKISSLKIPMDYDAVLELIPRLHLRPPQLPSSVQQDEFFPVPPNKGYDFIFHIGAAGRGPLRMERMGHKLAYYMKDAHGKLAPTVRAPEPEFLGRPEPDVSIGESFQVGVGQLGFDMVETAGAGDTFTARPNRGFGVGYEKFSEG